MTRGAPTPGPLLGAGRYGASSSSGPDPAARYLAMPAAELAELECYDLYVNREVILAAATQFTAEQRAALSARAGKCANTAGGGGDFWTWIDPRLLVEGAKGVAADPIGAITDNILGSGLLGGVADVVGNAVLALGGVVLVVAGVLRLFGVSATQAAKTAATRGAG